MQAKVCFCLTLLVVCWSSTEVANTARRKMDIAEDMLPRRIWTYIMTSQLAKVFM